MQFMKLRAWKYVNPQLSVCMYEATEQTERASPLAERAAPTLRKVM